MSSVFSTIVGNNSLKEMLGADLKNKTHNHAYIIEGPRGSGKKTLATEICKALLCTGGGDVFPCNKCPSCKKINASMCTDIYVLNKGDSASIAVESVRKMTETALFLPDDGDYKVYIIDEAEKMTPQAQNAFLLSLEEPPPYVLYLLLCNSSSKLLETIRSRAQTVKMQIFSNDFVAQWLRSHHTELHASDERIAFACAVSGGCLGVALECLADKQESTALKTAREARELVEKLCTACVSEKIIYCMGMKHTRAEFDIMFDYALLAVRDLIAVKSGSDDTLFYENAAMVTELSSKIKLQKLITLYDALENARYDITANNASVSAVMTSLATNDI